MTISRQQSSAHCSDAAEDAGPSRPDCRPGDTDNTAPVRYSRRTWALQSVLLCSTLLLLQPPIYLAVTPLTDWKSGIATNYGGPYDGKNPYDPSWGTLEGSCGYGKLDKTQWPYWSVAALASSNSFVQNGPLNGCGQCFEVKCVDAPPFQGRCITGSNQVSVIVQITDICPECAADHIDIQALTYNKLSNMDTGRISIMYRRVECVPPKPMVIYVDNNGGQGNWLRLFVEQAGGQAAVKQVQVRTSGSQDAYQNLNNKWGSDWETANAPKFPLDINIIGADGESVSAYQVIPSGGTTGKMSTSVQFKIANPSDQALTAAINSDGSTTGVGARGDSLSPAAAPSAGGAASSGGCTDTPPSSTYTCQQQKDFNACSQSWMAAGNFCAKTCGRCSGSGSNSAASGSPSGGSSSPSGSPRWSPSPSWSPSNSPSSSPSWSSSNSPSWSPSPNWSPSPSWSPSNSPSWSPSPNWSPSNSPSWSPSNSPSWSPSNSPSWSPSNSPSWSPSNSPSWSPPYSPSSNSPYASGGRKLLAPAQQASAGAADGDDGRLVITLVSREE